VNERVALDAARMTWERFVSPRGAIVFLRVEGNCLEDMVWGHMDVNVALRIQQELDVLRHAHGVSRGFHHWANAPTYDTDYRQSWMDWLERQKGNLLEAHFVTQSKFVKLGLSVANMAYSRIKFRVHSEESTYLEARKPYMSDVPMPKP
jgi:hypothetical protein